ncbi:nose resistant to fluoxetine protein 6-like [Pocillopora verrucosa]|uniref:nose resistant to fluoxetine protein 6-like n=1 Tax=Pocillopora verrucosa TaxID=203993 RepID=UPI00333F1E13
MAMLSRTSAVFLLFFLSQMPYMLALSLSGRYAQFAQLFGLPSTLPNISLASAGVSEECFDAVTKLNASTLAYYLDAIGKPPSGMLLGNFAMIGSYSECTKTIVEAHYCTAFLSISQLNVTEEPVIPLGLHQLSFPWGLCVPKSCDEQDVVHALQYIFQQIDSPKFTLKPYAVDEKEQYAYCNKKSEYTTGVIITLAVCGFILFLCLLGTIVDCILSFLEPHPAHVSKSDSPFSDKERLTATDHDNLPSNQKSDHVTAEKIPLLESSSHVKSGPWTTLSIEQTRRVRQHRMVRFFLCFSLIQNTSCIMDTKIPAGAITSINGMRVVTMWWIILGHCYAMLFAVPIGNVNSLKRTSQRFTFQMIRNGTLSTDTFFFLSGLLVSYLSLRRMIKNEGKLPLLFFYFHRIWRLTPTYMFVLLFYVKISEFLGEGPGWFVVQEKSLCNKYWWTNLLYINNFYPKPKVDGGCMMWSWYLASDMQFYTIAPVILFIAYWLRLRGLLAIVAVLSCASFAITGTLYSSHDLTDDDFALVYTKPYCRIASYLVGMVLGYFFHHTKDYRLPTKVKKYVFNVTGWCLAIVLAVSSLYGKYKTVREHNPHPFSPTQEIAYGILKRFAWSLAIAWVIFACQSGLGGLVNRILSARFWIPLSRLTYCAYLVHVIVLQNLYARFESVWFYTDSYMVFRYVGIVGISYGVAFIVSVCVEFPTMQLEKLIFRSKS